MNAGQLTPATPAALLKDTPAMGSTRPKSIVIGTVPPRVQPTVLFCTQK